MKELVQSVVKCTKKVVATVVPGVFACHAFNSNSSTYRSKDILEVDITRDNAPAVYVYGGLVSEEYVVLESFFYTV
jgi:hypothetical protein